MAPFRCPPPGCYPPVAERWEITNEWTGRSTLIHSSRLQPAQWSQDVWDRVMLYTGVPKHALEEFHQHSRAERRKSRSRSRGRASSVERPLHRKEKESRSRSRGRYHHVDRIREGQYNHHVPTKRDFTVQPLDKRHSQKELKSILKHRDSRIFFDDVRGPYYGLNTFSNHPVVYDGHKFPTAEHLLLYFRVS